MKIMTIVGTRPEVIRLSEVIKRLDRAPEIEHILVHTGQNFDYELNRVFFSDLELREPDHRLEIQGSSLGGRLGSLFSTVDPILEAEAPDAVLVLGDTYSCLAAILVKNRRIPIFHMEAGNRCHDMNVPEESNRRIVDHIADVNLTYSEHAREYLAREGLPRERIIKTGSPMREVLNRNLRKIMESEILSDLGLSHREYIVCSIHRAETVDCPERRHSVFSAIAQIAGENPECRVIVSLHPRTRNRVSGDPRIDLPENVEFHKPMSFTDYNRLQMSSLFVLSDSGTISEEASIIGFRALNVRDTHERPEAMDSARVILTGTSTEDIIRAARIVRSCEPVSEPVEGYDSDRVSEKILKIIVSYTPYINTYVYRKSP